MAAKIPYIGSKISLISKAAIRYEGTLYTINPYEATVALANVRSFGTEDREATLVVPPREEVYEYIIFRGSDIRDIHVCEPPPPTPPQDPAIVESSQPKPIGSDTSLHGPLPGAPGYPGFAHLNRPPPISGAPPGSGRLPASLSTSRLPASLSQQPPFPQQTPSSQPSTPGLTSVPTKRAESAGRQTPTQDQSTQVSQTALKKSSQLGSKPSSKNGSRGSTPTHDRQSPDRQQDRRRQNQHGGPQRRYERGGFHDNRGGFHDNRGGFHDNRGGFHDNRGGFHDNRGGFHDNRGGFHDNRGGFHENRGGWRGGDRAMDREGGWREQNRGREFRPRGRGGGPRNEHGDFAPREGGGEFRGPYRGRGGVRGRGRGMGGNRPQKLTFDEDFDFETANAQFNKDDLEKELREKLSLGEATTDGEKVVNGDDGSGSDDETFYDKDNFFDNISCEASDREKGKRSRPNWKEERKTNTETFGLSSTRDLRYYGRGGMRGGRGGMYRGGPRGGRGGGWGPRGGGRGGGGWRGRNNYNNNREGGGRPFRAEETTNTNKPEAGPPEVEATA